jgi:hypothetical protein
LVILLVQWLFAANTVRSAEVSAPLGLIGAFDSLGYNKIQWLYPGLQDTTYRSGSNVRCRGMYVSKDPGAHQIASRFVLSPSRQVPEFAEIWVEKGRDYSNEDWSNHASLRIGLFDNTSIIPGNPLIDFEIYSPAAAGIPPEGGYLHVDFFSGTPVTVGDTVWLVVEWPPEFPDLVCLGVDCEPAMFQTLFRVGGLPDSEWQVWVLHNFMILLATLPYANECIPQDEENPDQEFTISRYEIAPDDRETVAPNYACIPGSQFCFEDTAVIVDFRYEYIVRAVNLEDTSRPAIVGINPASPFPCELEFEEQSPVVQGAQLQLPCSFTNYGHAPLEVNFSAGWLRPVFPADGVAGPEPAVDSIPLQADSPTIVFNRQDSGEFVLRPKTKTLDCGVYEVCALFRVGNNAGRQAAYLPEGIIEIISAGETGIQNEGEVGPAATPSVRLFPNPGREQITVEFTPPVVPDLESGLDRVVAGGGRQSCRISVLNILGQEVAPVEYHVIDITRGRYGISLNCRDKHGNQLPTGLYFVTVRAQEWSLCRKLMIMH